jgi:hypothetical protein
MRLTVYFLFLASGFAQNASFPTLEVPKHGFLGKLSVKSSFSYTLLPWSLIQSFGGLSKSPDWMKGTGFDGQIAYQLSGRIGIYASYESSNIHGSGPWEPSGSNQQEAAAGVTGYAKGKVGTDSYGVGLGSSVRLHRTKSSQLSVEVGAVRVQRTTNFSGMFYGNDGQSDFVAPAADYEHITGFQPEGRLVLMIRFVGPLAASFSTGFGLNGPEFKAGLALTEVFSRNAGK